MFIVGNKNLRGISRNGRYELEGWVLHLQQTLNHLRPKYGILPTPLRTSRPKQNLLYPFPDQTGRSSVSLSEEGFRITIEAPISFFKAIPRPNCAPCQTAIATIHNKFQNKWAHTPNHLHHTHLHIPWIRESPRSPVAKPFNFIAQLRVQIIFLLVNSDNSVEILFPFSPIIFKQNVTQAWFRRRTFHLPNLTDQNNFDFGATVARHLIQTAHRVSSVS